EALTFPLGGNKQPDAQQKVIDHAARFFEETWIHRPRKSLEGNSPVNAVGLPRLRRKLFGVIQLMQECAVNGALASYDPNRLRRKLGLTEAAQAAAAPAPTPGVAGDISAMSTAELASLDIKALSDEQLEKAYQTAYRLDAQDLAGLFASTLVDRPVQAGKTDRYPWYAFLIQKALRE